MKMHTYYHFLKEEVLTQDDYWLQPSTNQVGWAFLPVINQEVNTLNSWTYSNADMQLGINMYPGEVWCNPVIPHVILLYLPIFFIYYTLYSLILYNYRLNGIWKQELL